MIRVTQRVAQLVVESPYSGRFVEGAKKIGGRWSPEARAWAIPLSERPALRQLLLESYGADGGLPDEPPRAMRMPTAADVDALAARLIVGWAGWGAGA